jgi:hypothetical protein
MEGAMQSRSKLFRDSIFRILFGVYSFFQGWYMLAGFSDAIYSDIAVTFWFGIVVVISVVLFVLLWSIRDYKRNKLPFKTDKKTKAMTYSELAVSITGFSFFGIAAFARSIFDPLSPDLAKNLNMRHILHPYSGLAFWMVLLGFLFVGISYVLYYSFLPKQIIDEGSIPS